MAKNRKSKPTETLDFPLLATNLIAQRVIYQGGVFGYAEIERDDGDDLDIDIHMWPTDADHCLSSEPWNCPCLPRVEINFASGVRLIVHRKTQ